MLLKDFKKKKSYKIAKKIISIAIILIIFYFLGKEIYDSWSLLPTFKWRFNFPFLFASILVLLISYFFSPYCWNLIMRNLKEKLSYKKSMKIWGLSQLGKYIPGKVWTFLGMIYLCKTEKISAKKGAAAAVLMTLFDIVSAVLLSIYILCYIAILYVKIPLVLIPLLMAFLLFLVFISIHPKVWNFFLNLVLKILKRKTIKFKIAYPIKILFVYIIKWVIIGSSFYLFLISVYTLPLNFKNWLTVLSIWVISWEIGFLSLLTPIGLGVREGMITLLLQILVNVPPPVGAIIAISSRLWSLFVELFFIGVVALVK